MEKTVTRFLLLSPMLAAAIGVSAWGQSSPQAASAVACQAAPAAAAQRSAVRHSQGKKRTVQSPRLADVRTPQQVELTIRFQ